MAYPQKRVRKTRRRGKSLLVPALLCLLVGGVLYAGFSFFFDKKDDGKQQEQRVAKKAGVGIRGSFFDCNRKELATTLERVAVYVRSREVVSFKETAKALARALSLKESVIESRLKRGGLHVWIAEDITQQQEEEVKKLASLGVHLQKERKRYYPYGAYGAHILGFAENGIGLSGLEALYDQFLAKKKQELLKSGIPLTYQQDMVLTLDLKVQKILEELLSEIRRESVLQGINIRAAAYLLDSKSGALLAGAQAPGFNPNNYANYSSEVLENMFFAPFFVPDSIRALIRDCAGFYKTENDAVLAGAWSVSSPRFDSGRQLQLVEKLGFGHFFDVDFHAGKKQKKSPRGEQIRNVKRQRNMEMIPEVSTPVNLLVALSTLLHGKPARIPYTVSGMLDNATGELYQITHPALAADKLALPDMAVRRLFAATGKTQKHGLIIEGSSIGQFLLPHGEREFVRNKVVFADIPAGGNPLALLLVTEVREGGPFVKAQTRNSSLSLARIVAKRIGRISILHMVTRGSEGLLPQETEEYGNYQGEERFTVENDVVMRRRAGAENRPVRMPDLYGMSLRKALRQLQGVPVKFSFEGAGWVKKQSPAAGTELKKNTLCRLVLEQGPTLRFDGFSPQAESR